MNSITKTLLDDLASTKDCNWAELYNQVCHQHTYNDATFEICNHLYALVNNMPNESKFEILRVFSNVAQSKAFNRTSKWNTQAIYDDFIRKTKHWAMTMSNQIFLGKKSKPATKILAVQTVAAYIGCFNTSLLLDAVEDDNELVCPDCGEYIRFFFKSRMACQKSTQVAGRPNRG